MQCAKCGTELKEGTKFCTNCGNVIDTGAASVSNAQDCSEVTMVLDSEATVLLDDYEVNQRMQAVNNAAPKTADHDIPVNRPEEVNANYMQQQPKDRKRKLLILLAVVLGLVILIEMIFLFLLNKKEEGVATLEEETATEEMSSVEEAAETGEELLDDQEANEQEESAVEEENVDEFHKILAWISENENGMLGLNYLAPRKYFPAVRNTSLEWDRTLFYTLEDVSEEKADDGQINYYKINKKQGINAANNNLIEFEIYSHPTSNDIQKIVTIEHCDDYLDIYEYYFQEGKINFVFQTTNVVYTPTYATPDKPGCRYYYNSDTLVKFRGVDENKNLQDYYVDKLDTYDETFQTAYNDVEANILNRAYIVYDFIQTIPEVGYIKGYVLDENNAPIDGASIAAYLEDEEINRVQSGQDGEYTLAVPANEEHGYNLSIAEGNSEEEKVYDINIGPESVLYYTENIYMFQDYNSSYDVEVLLCDAFNEDNEYEDNTYSKMERLSDAVLNIRRGNNNKRGEIIVSTVSDSDGYAYANLAVGNYTGEIEKDGYESSYFTITVKPDNLFIQSIASPELAEDEVRIVLTWGEYPYDLDAHLFTPHWGEQGDMQHIGYYEREDSYGNNLDVDDRTGYGPETITINNVTEGLYKYFVKDFTNCSMENYSSTDMSYSDATVFVFSGSGRNAVFHVPMGEPGVIWEVFEIRNKQIIPIQRYYANTNDKNW